MTCRRHRLALALAAAWPAAACTPAWSAPYASNIQLSGTTVNFILNEPADMLTYSINGGPAQALDGAAKGAKTFNLTAATDTFSITAKKNAAVGYTISTGATILTAASGLGADSNEGGLAVISDDANVLTRFNSPRGVSVSNDPNAANFGTAYISNSAAGTNTESGRALGDGMYALRADQSDAFGYGDEAKNPNLPDGFPAFITNSASSPWRAFVADNGEVYVADWSDANGNLIRLAPDLNSAEGVFADFGGPTALPPGQNHGSVVAAWVEGSTAQGNLTVYTVDEDLTSLHVTGDGSSTDQNSLWRYEIGSGPLLSTATPTKIADELIPAAVADVHRGADGKFYLAQNRFAGVETGIAVVDADGTQLYTSRDASRTLLNDPAANDILRNVQGMAVSEDQKWMALMINNSDVAVLPLVDGIPDLANRVVINTGTDINSGRDIAFDAAGNIHYVSSGQGRYRVLAPGGNTTATTSWNGTQFSFSLERGTTPGLAGDFDGDNDVDGNDFLVWQRGGSPAPLSAADLAAWKTNFGTVGAAATAAAVPEPAGLGLAGLALLALAAGRRK